MRTKHVALLAVALFLAMTIVMAETSPEAWSEPPKVTVDAPTLWEKIVNFFRIEAFSIIGVDRTCDTEPLYRSGSISSVSQTSYLARGKLLGYWSFSQGTVGGSSQTYASNFCSSGHGLYDVYCQANPLASPGDTGAPRFEMKDAFYFNCGPTCAKCNVELYCCPDDCDVGGTCPTGSTCTTKTATDPYLPLKDAYGGGSISSYKYCQTSSCSGSKTCYRLNSAGTACESSTYPCTYATYSTIVNSNCAQGAGTFIYSSQSTCQANVCVPSSSCAANTCVGQTCTSCGNTYSGTKVCTSGCTADNSCAANTCTGSSCQDNCGNSYQGTKDCGATGGEADLVTDVEVVEIILPPTASTFNPEIEQTFKVTLKNQAADSRMIKVEYGFYTPDYAQNIAKLYSILPFFATVNPISSCVSKEPFVKTVSITLEPNEEKTVSLKIEPYNAFITLPVGQTRILKDTKLVSFLGVLAHNGENSCCKKLPEFEGCAEGTGGYLKSQYDPNFHINDALSFFGSTSITCDGEVYGTIDYNLGDDTVTISRDYNDCISFNFYTENGTINKTATADYEAKARAGELSKIYKVSLTKAEITRSPTPQLLASACKMDSECLPRKEINSSVGTEPKQYSISCSSIASLRDDGTISESKVKDVMATGKQLVTNGIIGGTIGGAAGIGLCALGVGAASVATFTTGVGGALLIPATATCASLIGASALVGAGVGVGGTLAFNALTDDDELVKALKAGDANGIGICTASEPSSTFDIGGMLKSIGKTIKITGNETTDGIIVIIGGFFVLSILINMMRSNR